MYKRQHDVHPVSQEVQPDCPTQQRVMAEHCPAVADGIGRLEMCIRDRIYTIQAPIVIMDDSSFATYCEQIGVSSAKNGSVVLNRIWAVSYTHLEQGLGKALPNKIYQRGKTADMRILAPW